MNQLDKNIEQGLVPVISRLILIIVLLVLALMAIPFLLIQKSSTKNKVMDGINTPSKSAGLRQQDDQTIYWIAPDINSIQDQAAKEEITYGKELISHTAKYLGPRGSVLQISNGLNCQNCHLQAGTAVFGNNYGSVSSLYPKFRARSGTREDIKKRINDCFERSLNGKPILPEGKEMKAIVAYINFLGTNVEKGKKAEGSGFKVLAMLERAADPLKGLTVYKAKCQSCHQENGEGVLNPDKTEYDFPALWGQGSFNDGAGLYRLSNFAKFIKYNMPQGSTHKDPQLTDEEAWDVASYVVSQPRPHLNTPNDWPDKSQKPFDHPFGPYSDSFSRIQHKYGPFKPILDDQKKKSIATNNKSTDRTK